MVTVMDLSRAHEVRTALLQVWAEDIQIMINRNTIKGDKIAIETLGKIMGIIIEELNERARKGI